MAFFDELGDKRMERQNGAAWRAIAHYVNEASGDLPPGQWNVLDWGCHSGGLIHTLQQEFGSRIGNFAGVDPDDDARKRAKDRFPRTLFVKDLTEIGNQSIDVFVSHEVLYLVELDYFFKELKRVLRLGGAAFVALGSHGENQAWLERREALDETHGILSYVHQPMEILQKSLTSGFHPPEFQQLWPAGYPGVLRYTPPAPDWKEWRSVEEALEFRRQKLIFQFWPQP